MKVQNCFISLNKDNRYEQVSPIDPWHKADLACCKYQVWHMSMLGLCHLKVNINISYKNNSDINVTEKDPMDC